MKPTDAGQRRRWVSAVLLLVLVLCLGAAPLGAQEELPGPGILETRLEAWRGEASSVLRSGADSEAAAAAEITLELLENQLEAAKRASEVEQEAALAAEELEGGASSSLEQRPPFDFVVLDSVLDRRTVQGQAELLANEAIDAAVRELEEAERSRREMGPASEEEWAKRAALTRVELARQRLLNARKEQETARCRFDLAKELVSFVSDRLDARPQDLHAMEERFEERQMELAAARSHLEHEAELAERRWDEARLKWEGTDSAATRAEVGARRAALESADAFLRLHGDQVERVISERDTWRHRFTVALDEGAVPAPERGLDDISSSLDRQARERELGLKNYRAERRGLDSGPGGSENRPSGDLASGGETQEADGISTWHRRHRASLEAVIDAYEEDLADIDRLQVLFERVQAECTPRGLRLQAWMGDIGQALTRAWYFELLVVDERPITVGKAFMALLLILLGYRVSKRISRALGRLLERRLHMGSGAAAALQNLVLYVLLVFFFLWALQLVGIPLTVFTVLGGVVAIGLGFGSQNIVSNFISGLILLVERPIKVGDLIEVDSVLGSVEQIGLRSTRIRAGDNTHVIVPNSSFLEKNVLNWTVSDDVIRTEVDVGVAYGSPTEDVRRLIEKALEEEPTVLPRPAWDVLFIEFGDNALHFRAFFWIRVDGLLDKLRAGSAVRFRIDALFREAGISISFPQRDVHLDTLTPLEVRLIDSSE